MMIEINLLPKEYRKKSFDFSFGKAGLYGVVGAAAVIVLLITLTFYQNYQLTRLDEDINKAKERASMLEKDIKFVDALMDVKTKINLRMNAVERLDSHRSSWVRILEDLARNVPEFVWIGKLSEIEVVSPTQPRTQPNAKVKEAAPKPAPPANAPMVRPAKIEGYAFTLNALASFMIKMMRSDYFDEIELVSTEDITLEEKKTYKFELSFNVHYLSDEELRNLFVSNNINNKSSKGSKSHKILN